MDLKLIETKNLEKKKRKEGNPECQELLMIII